MLPNTYSNTHNYTIFKLSLMESTRLVEKNWENCI